MDSNNVPSTNAMSDENSSSAKPEWTSLEKEIEDWKKTALSTSDEHPEKAQYLRTLGDLLLKRFERLGELKDLDEAVVFNTKAVSLSPDEHPDKPDHLDALSKTLGMRFQRLGDLNDIDQAVDKSRKAVSLAPDDDLNQPGYLNALGNILSIRFNRCGDIIDLHDAVEISEIANALTPDEHPSKPASLSNLGILLRTRFDCHGETKDLDEAIEAISNAVRLTPEDNLDKHIYLSNLALSLQARFERIGELQNIDRAIDMYSKAVSLVPEGHPKKSLYLGNISRSHQIRYERLGELKDIEEAVNIGRKAASLAPDGHPDASIRLTNLSSALKMRFDRIGELADLDEAISTSSKASTLTPERHSEKPNRVSRLGVLLQTRSEYLGAIQDRDEAIRSFRESATALNANPSSKLKSALAWAALVQADASEALQAYEVVIDLIPQIVWLGSPVEHSYHSIKDLIGNSVSEAATAAIVAGENDKAVEWLEQGRSIIWGQLLGLRTPMNALQATHPALAHELQFLSTRLQQAAFRNSTSDIQSLSLEREAQAHRRSAEQREMIITNIRSLPGFEDFLKPKTFSQLSEAARDGPIVILSIHSSRCDALIIRPGNPSVLLVPLQNCSMEELANLKTICYESFEVRDKVSRLEDVLAVLWSTIVQPVLAALGILDIKSSGSLPHITWCPTGPLTSLPLHAAGIYTPTGPRIYNYVVSSYTPTLTALLQAPPQIPFNGILAICWAQRGLDQTSAEVEHIQKYFGQDSVTRLDGENATVDTVLEQMANHSWVHFACSAEQKADDPLSSAFILHEGRLSLTDLMKTMPINGGFAFLSASETAKGDENLPNEWLHLAAAIMMLGYPSVIATPWKIGHEEVLTVSESVYSRLYNHGEPDEKIAARALHEAVSHLREKDEKNFSAWVPFIHIGA